MPSRPQQRGHRRPGRGRLAHPAAGQVGRTGTAAEPGIGRHAHLAGGQLTREDHPRRGITHGRSVHHSGSDPTAGQSPTAQSATTGPTTAPTVTPQSPPPRTSTSAAPAAPPTSTASGDGIDLGCQLQSSWPTGYVAQFVVRSAGNGVDAWSVSWPDPDAVAVANAWGLTCAVAAGGIHCQGADWAAHIPAGGTVTVGLQVVTDGIAPASPTLTIGH